MFFWSKFPFVRITIAFAIGITASVFLPEFENFVLIITLCSLVFLVSSSFFKKIWFLKYNWLYGFLLITLSFSLGYGRLYLEKAGSRNVQSLQGAEISSYEGRVVSQPIKKGKYYKSTVEISLLKDSIWQPLSYNINLYVKAERKPFNYGDDILVKGRPLALKGPQNPDEFNYKRYLTFLTTYQQHFTDSTLISVLSSKNGSSLITASFQLREKFSDLLEKHIKEPKELGIAKALLLGNKNELDDDIKNTYAASGAMHVLAVSGLHVGIIYAIIFWLFSRLPKQYQKKWLIAVISIPLLWGYAFITGLSPSVLRAVTLFTIIAIGNSINRRSSMVNILAVSGLILLVYKPYLLMQVGFQLSYLAVLGIIFIYPQIRKLLMPSNRIWVFFWDVTSISIAAQLATFPLSILYFHRFPPYFLVSNLVVIPAATLIVCVGIGFFTVSLFSDVLAAFLGSALYYIIRSINWVLEAIYHFPFSDISNIYLNVPQTWLTYSLIVFLYLFMVYRNNAWAILASFTMILLSVFIGFRWVENNELKQIAIYNVPYHYSVDLIQSGEVLSLMDSVLIQKSDKIHFHINPNRLLHGASNYLSLQNIPSKQMPYGKVLIWNGVSILVLNRHVENESFPYDIVLSSSGKQMIKTRNESENLNILLMGDNSSKSYNVN